MVRIDGEVNQASMMSAVTAERNVPTGSMQMTSTVDAGNIASMVSACQAMVEAHPGG